MLFSTLCVSTDAAANDPNAADLARMQGDWMVSSMIAGGMKLEDEEAQTLFRTVEGDKYKRARASPRKSATARS